MRLELPDDTYVGVASWYSNIDWLIQADIAYRLYYRALRHLVCDHAGRGGCSREAFNKVCAARAIRADWQTGRGSRLSVATIMTLTGLSERTVQRATLLMKAFGLATEVFRGRQRTLEERLISHKAKERARGWASVYALHPPNNPQVTRQKFREDPLPATRVTPHLRSGALCSSVSVSKNSSIQTSKAGNLNGRASRDPATTKQGRRKRRWPAPDAGGLLLARKWRQHPQSPLWAQKHCLEAWAAPLAELAAHSWTVRDLHQLVEDHRGLPWITHTPSKPLVLMRTLIKRYRELDDIACPPAYYDQQRDAEAAARRFAIATCSACGEDGYALDAAGLPIEPVRRCAHSSSASP